MAPPPKKYEEVFKKGTVVEVSSEEEGMRGSWYTATVQRAITRKTGKILVEYQNLTVEECKPLREMVDWILVRPTPPAVDSPSRFDVGEEVDAYHQDGWWEGIVISVVEVDDDDDCKWRRRRYAVFFRSSREQIEFDESDLRLHREWIGGDDWVPPPPPPVDLKSSNNSSENS